MAAMIETLLAQVFAAQGVSNAPTLARKAVETLDQLGVELEQRDRNLRIYHLRASLSAVDLAERFDLTPRAIQKITRMELLRKRTA